ncbi:MAG: NlpC/P60 family protein [Acidimicrobiales bacterium]
MPLPTHSARTLSRRRRSRLVRLICGTALGALLSTTTLSTPSFADPTSSGSSSTTSTTSGTSSSQAQINATESQVASIESQIANQQQVLDQDDEHYDQLSVNLTSTRAALSSTQASIRVAKAKLTSERTHLAKDAVQSYIGDTSGNAVASLFAAPTSGSQTRTLYEQVGVGNVVVDVKRVQATSHQLNTTQSKLLSEQQAETTELAAENQARQSASSAAALSEGTLAQVKGTLAQEIAQQAAAEAATAAQEAASATTAAQRQQAAADAESAAQVAGTVGAGSAAASAATDSANQAAGSALGPIGYGNDPQAAGLAAVHGAMQYLGVPYVWGGASGAGVDCSGLTMLAWAQAGVSLLHSAADQYADSEHVSLSDLEPGDLLFYDFDGTGIDHVVMYVGPVLDGQATPYGVDTIIQAAHTGTVVSFNPFWYDGLVGAARP